MIDVVFPPSAPQGAIKFMSAEFAKGRSFAGQYHCIAASEICEVNPPVKRQPRRVS